MIYYALICSDWERAVPAFLLPHYTIFNKKIEFFLYDKVKALILYV